MLHIEVENSFQTWGKPRVFVKSRGKSTREHDLVGTLGLEVARRLALVADALAGGLLLGAVGGDMAALAT
jgi:hypothetical protein